MPSLHITNGYHAGDKLRRIVDGAVALACDVLHEGPCPAVDGEAWHEVRGQFLSGPDHPADQVKATLAAAHRAILDACERGGQLVLWFEHDLFDQLAIIRTLDLVGRALSDPARGSRARASMICIDRFPGVDRFIGLGQLSGDQLATLIGTERPVTAEQFALATDAWDAFRSGDPNQLLTVSGRADALPFLRDALRRFLAEYPSVANGLSRSEQLVLDALGRGALPGGELFMETQRQEAQPFMGDLTFFEIVRSLAGARVPLVTIAAAAEELDLRSVPIAITEAGRDVAAGRRDHILLNGIDCWRGGVHLSGSNRSPWRWDAQRERLVS